MIKIAVFVFYVPRYRNEKIPTNYLRCCQVMSVSVAKPVVAASLVASTVVYLGYLWYKHRAEAKECSDPPTAVNTERHLEQVQQRLHTIRRSRLETLEEEPASSEHHSKDQTVTISEHSEETLKSEEISLVNSPVEECRMAVEESGLAPVPDVFSALNDPLCGESDSYSSSPVKSESAQSKSSCEWSDLIEQDLKEMQVCPP